MGSVLRLPVAAFDSVHDAMADAHRHGLSLAATVPRSACPIRRLDFDGPVALLIGGEGVGLSPDVVADADQRVTIPMCHPVESLNAAVAAAILLYEATRQRTKDGRLIMTSLFDDGEQPPPRPQRRHHSRNACGPARSMSSSGKRNCSPADVRCVRRSSATCSSRSCCGVRRAPARRHSRESLRTRPRRASSPSARFWPASRKSARSWPRPSAMRRATGRRTIVFIDEIHRFNKAQQDAFLPRVEAGDIVLVGATTENPSFEVNAALLSRSKVFVLRGLNTAEVAHDPRTGADRPRPRPRCINDIGRAGRRSTRSPSTPVATRGLHSTCSNS